MIYKDVCIPNCPNKCFEKMIDEAEEENIKSGVNPRFNAYGLGSSTIYIRRYSKRLKRHAHRANGNYLSKEWTNCPLCGERLIEK